MIGSLNRQDNEHGTRFKCKLNTSFLIFIKIYCWYTSELSHRSNSNVYLQYVFPIIVLPEAFLDKFLANFIVPLK